MSEEPQEIRPVGSERSGYIGYDPPTPNFFWDVFFEKFLCNNVILKTKPFCGFLFC